MCLLLSQSSKKQTSAQGKSVKVTKAGDNGCDTNDVASHGTFDSDDEIDDGESCDYTTEDGSEEDTLKIISEPKVVKVRVVRVVVARRIKT